MANIGPASDSESTARAQPPPKRQAGSSKRQQIKCACNECARLKVKCDGERPCARCSRLDVGCNYEADQGQTRTQAAKRRLGDVETQYRVLNDLLGYLIARPDRESLGILNRLRAGEDRATVLQSLKTDGPKPSAAFRSDHDARTMILACLLQCTGSLEDVMNAAESLDTVGVDIRQNITNLKSLRNSVVTLQTLSNAMTVPTQRTPTSLNLSGGQFRNAEQPNNVTNHRISQGDPRDVPLVMVPAKPWTHLVDEVSVSRLMMVFFNYINAYWRYVEEDIFLRAMMSGRAGSEYCSPFLVNAICALACLSAEYDGSFVETDVWVTRGEHFHDEAMRLWVLEAGRASLTSLQALVVMAMESSLRGRDKQGSVLMAAAVQMNKDLPLSDDSIPEQGEAATRHRARTCIAWTTHFADVTYQLSLLRVAAPIDPRLGFVPNLPDESKTWHARPFKHLLKDYRANVLFRERCMLTRMSSELNYLMWGEQIRTSQSRFQDNARSLGQRLTSWYENLPTDFRYSKDLPAPVLELHAQYQCTMQFLCMAISDTGPPRDPNISMQPNNVDHIAEMQQVRRNAAGARARSIDFALHAAGLLKEYRETYGLKITMPCIFQAEALTSLMLMRRLAEETTMNDAKGPAGGDSATIRDMQSSFEESLRCLLGSATQSMLARGVARLVQQTARELPAPLSPLAARALQTFDQATWSGPSDLASLSSAYPNYAVADSPRNYENIQMEEFLTRLEDRMT